MTTQSLVDREYLTDADVRKSPWTALANASATISTERGGDVRWPEIKRGLSRLRIADTHEPPDATSSEEDVHIAAFVDLPRGGDWLGLTYPHRLISVNDAYGGSWVDMTRGVVLQVNSFGGWTDITQPQRLIAGRDVSGSGISYSLGRASNEFAWPSGILSATPGRNQILLMKESVASFPADKQNVVWLDSTLARVNNLFRIDPTDDLHRAPDPAYAVEALTFLSLVLPENAAPPSVAPLDDGGIQAEWHRGGIDVEVLFSPDPEERGIWIRDKATGEESDLPLTREAFVNAVGDRLRVDS